MRTKLVNRDHEHQFIVPESVYRVFLNGNPLKIKNLNMFGDLEESDALYNKDTNLVLLKPDIFNRLQEADQFMAMYTGKE